MFTDRQCIIRKRFSTLYGKGEALLRIVRATKACHRTLADNAVCFCVFLKILLGVM